MEQLIESSQLQRSGGYTDIASANNLASLYLKMGAIASAACNNVSDIFPLAHLHDPAAGSLLGGQSCST